MIKLISKQDAQPIAKTKPMYEMQPLEVCVIIEGGYRDRLVMRTVDTDHFEVIDLANPRPDTCWVGKPSLKVRELYPGETYTLELS